MKKKIYTNDKFISIHTTISNFRITGKVKLLDTIMTMQNTCESWGPLWYFELNLDPTQTARAVIK